MSVCELDVYDSCARSFLSNPSTLSQATKTEKAIFINVFPPHSLSIGPLALQYFILLAKFIIFTLMSGVPAANSANSIISTRALIFTLMSPFLLSAQ